MPFAYKARTPEQWDKRASGKLFEGFIKDEYTTLTLKDQNAIRILPPTWENPSHYGMDIWVHYGVGPVNASVLCLYRMRGAKCPICEAYGRAELAGRQDADDLKPTRRVLVWSIDRSDEKRPVLWAMPQTVDTQISAICLDRVSGELFQIDHPDSGFDVYFSRRQKGGGARNVEYYGFQLARRPTSVDPNFMEYIIQHPVPITLQWRDYNQIEALFMGGSEHEERPEAAALPSPIPSSPLTPPPFQPQYTQPIQPQPVSTVRTTQAPFSTAPPPVAVAPPPAIAPSTPPPQPFVSQWTNTHCSICSEPQYTTPSGITCKNGHGGATPLEDQAGNGQPQPTPQAQPQLGSRTAALKARFEAGRGKV